ncbi:MAG: glycosyltransferase family 4 protein [Longimonas sp.]|uniref:glycosyltransferase family 4 protein n=1 Tax=Longimonas sp. TaxID=2039626 RepID=UPI003974A656
MDTPTPSPNRHPLGSSADASEIPEEQGDGTLHATPGLYATQMHTGGPARCQAPALVHDWLPVYAGAERVLEQMIHALPESSVYSLIDYIPDDQRAFLQGKSVQTSFIQSLPFSKKLYRYYLPLAPFAIEQFDLREHDVIVSSSYAVAKGILTRSDQLHISYVHSPMRYAWDLYHDYLEQSNLTRGVRSLLARMLMHYMRLYDSASASRVDVYVANSQYVARRIWKTYRRRAHVVYPPVDVEAFGLQTEKDDYYLTMARLVPYKRVDLIVDAFATMPDKELIVIGDGPELNRLKEQAGPNVTLLGRQPDEAVQYYMQHARAFVYAAEEDFGIAPVEAQACGTPVIAYGGGGVLETVVPGETGVLYTDQTAAHIANAVATFESQRDCFVPERIRAHAEQFSPERFRSAFRTLIDTAYQAFQTSEPWAVRDALTSSLPSTS